MHVVNHKSVPEDLLRSITERHEMQFRQLKEMNERLLALLERHMEQNG